jgi:hypothetical protein
MLEYHRFEEFLATRSNRVNRPLGTPEAARKFVRAEVQEAFPHEQFLGFIQHAAEANWQ